MLDGKSFKSILVASSILALTLCAVSPAAYAQGRRAVNLSGTPGLPFSDGIVVGNFLYVSGTQGTSADGKLASGISAQTRAALENIERVVKKAGLRMSDVVSVNVYLSDIHDFGEMNKVYTTFFPDPKP
ncbi:MAG TPA: RidA family protein, partial [Terriglobia bacterium]|nr:RidA family protein [Terriglobia bacterium]